MYLFIKCKRKFLYYNNKKVSLEPAIFERLRNSSLNKYKDSKNLGGLNN